MSSPKHCGHAFSRGIWVVLLVCLFPLNGMATNCDCSLDTAEPPFLSQGADPNVLMMIDNSASMYDVAYNDPALETYECFDDTFDTANSYTGYFENSVWYTYDTTDTRFVPVEGPLPNGTFYRGTDALGNDFVQVAVTGTELTGWTVQLYATGQFLNWATVSKFDIQKSILTGGKFDQDAQHWVSEGRGCAGYRFAKQVPVTSGGATYYLSMGIKADGGG
jgi:type IV pilus assembly protein PilY1